MAGQDWRCDIFGKLRQRVYIAMGVLDWLRNEEALFRASLSWWFTGPPRVAPDAAPPPTQYGSVAR